MFYEILISLYDTPIPAILVIGGVVFLFFAYVNKIGGDIQTDPKNKRSMIKIGSILIIVGIGLYAAPVILQTSSEGNSNSSNSTTQSANDSQQSNSPTNTATREDEDQQQSELSDCLSEEYIPAPGGVSPPVNSVICIPSGYIAWISSDPAYFEIPEIYSNTFTVGYAFVLFGPVKFSVSGVESSNIRLDLRTDISLLGNYDGKSINMVFQDGLVCDHAVYTGTKCP